MVKKRKSRDNRKLELLPILERVINAVKSWGLVGAVVCIGMGIILVAIELELWKIGKPETNFADLFDDVDTKQLIIGCFLFFLGLGVLFWQSNLWFLYRMRGIDRAARRYGLDDETATAARKSVTYETRGGTTKAFYKKVETLVEQLLENKQIKPEVANAFLNGLKQYIEEGELNQDIKS